MNIFKKEKDIHSLFSLAISEENVELELIFGHSVNNTPINKTIFIKLLEVLKQKYSYIGETNNLDIKCAHNKGLSNIRCTIKDLDSIKKYCKTNSLDDIDNLDFVEKSPYRKDRFLNTNIKNTDYNVRLNLKVEEDLKYSKQQKLQYSGNHDSKDKYYRYKKRYSFETQDNLFRIDLTVVKSTQFNLKNKTYNLSRSFKEANILNNPETYELEIEFIGRDNSFNDDFDFRAVERMGYSRILKYFNKLDKDIKNPKVHSFNHVHDPLSSGVFNVWKPTITKQSVFNLSSNKTVLDVPIKVSNTLKSKLIGKNVIIKDTYLDDNQELKDNIEFPEELYGVSKQPGMVNSGGVSALIIDCSDDFDKIQTVLLKFNITAYNDVKEQRKIRKEIQLIENKDLIKQKKDHKKKTELLSRLHILERDNKPLQAWVPVSDVYGTYLDIEQIVVDHYTEKLEEHKKEYGDEEPWWKQMDDLDEADMGGGAKPSWANQSATDKSKSNTKSSDFDPMKSSNDKVSSSYKSKSKSKSESVSSLNSDSVNILSNICIDLLNEHISELYYIINDYKHLISLSEKKDILSKYSKLTKQQYAKLRLLGPQPITLNHEHLNTDSPINIIHGYAVTEKADGYRAMLYITNNRGYLITSKLEVIYTGCKFPNVNGEWLLDGEYITKDKNLEDIKLYLIFDIYFNGNPNETKPAFNHIWYSENDKIMTRSKLMDDFKSKCESKIVDEKDSIDIGFKKYQYGAINPEEDDLLIFKKCRNILDTSDSYRYRIDGLILMPIYTVVNGDKSGTTIKNIGGTWDYNFKWKPPEENTIDFKVYFEKEGKRDKVYPIITEVEGGEKILHRYKKASLVVGYDQKQDPDIDYHIMMLTNERRKNLREKVFDPPNTTTLVNKTNLLLHNSSILCKDGTEIKDGDIVEMSYNPHGENDMIWEPLRVRYDKDRPQWFTIANNVWETISEPIYGNVIRGLEEDKFVKKETDSDLYYVGDSDSESKALRDYHNYIKSNLIRGVCNSLKKNIQVMDTSIGRGGDINKYLDNDCNVKYLLGLDISNVNEACKRYYYQGKKPLATFIQADTSLNIKTNVCDMGNAHTKTMLDIIYGTVKSVKGPYKKFYKEYKGLAKKGFDMINSQFTFHYYLKDKLTFDGYLMNINDNLNKGGYFIATFYDGMKLFDLLKTDDKIEYINGIGERVYSIEKKYDVVDFDYRESNTDNMFGNTIDVFMDSIGKEFPEYLVNIEFVVAEMKKIGLELATPDVSNKYETIFKKDCLIQEGRGDFSKILPVLDSLDKKSPDRDLIKKYYSRLPEMFKNKELQLLSGLNNYLVFRKV